MRFCCEVHWQGLRDVNHDAQISCQAQLEAQISWQAQHCKRMLSHVTSVLFHVVAGITLVFLFVFLSFGGVSREGGSYVGFCGIY